MTGTYVLTTPIAEEQTHPVFHTFYPSHDAATLAMREAMMTGDIEAYALVTVEFLTDENLPSYLSMLQSADVIDESTYGMVEAFIRHNGTHYMNNWDDVEDLMRTLEDIYQGEFNSTDEWAEEYFDGTGMLDEILENVPESLRYYVNIDYAGFARDCDMNGDVIFAEDSGAYVHVFNGQW